LRGIETSSLDLSHDRRICRDQRLPLEAGGRRGQVERRFACREQVEIIVPLVVVERKQDGGQIFTRQQSVLVAGSNGSTQVDPCCDGFRVSARVLVDVQSTRPFMEVGF
jgi:hypothetical protein